MIQFAVACARHRPALVDFVDHAEIGPETGAALGHLDRCARCTADLEVIAQTITALRRMGDDAARVEPAADAWPRLRGRLTRWRPTAWRIMSPIAGMTMSLAIVAVLVVPIRLGPASTPMPNLDRVVPTPAERRIEANYISTSHQGLLRAADSTPVSIVGGPRNYPDSIRPGRKEVTPAQPSGRPAEAI